MLSASAIAGDAGKMRAEAENAAGGNAASVSSGRVRYTGPAGADWAIANARSTAFSRSAGIRNSKSHLRYSRRMPAWSNDSCAQWIPATRETVPPFSEFAVRPAAKTTGARTRAAFMMPHTVFAVPTIVCTIANNGRPDTIA